MFEIVKDNVAETAYRVGFRLFAILPLQSHKSEFK